MDAGQSPRLQGDWDTIWPLEDNDGSARMAVTPTFPSRDSLRRLRFRPYDVTVGIGVLLLIYAVVRVGAGARAPFHPYHAAALISTSPAELPYYAARSLLRMFGRPVLLLRLQPELRLRGIAAARGPGGC